MTSKMWKAARRPLAVGGIVASQLAQAIHRPDLDSLTDQDPSGTFGDPSLPPLRIVVLGDSTVTAPGVEPLDDAWIRRTALALTDRYFVDVASLAVGGSKVEDVRREQVHRAALVGGDLAIVCVGGNDALRMTPVSRFEADYDVVARVLVEAFPAVGFSGVGDMGAIPRLPALAAGFARVRARSIDHAIGRVASRYGVPKSQAWGAAFDLFTNDPAAWAPDLFHASGRGHAVYAQAAMPLVDEALRRAGFARRGSDESST